MRLKYEPKGIQECIFLTRLVHLHSVSTNGAIVKVGGRVDGRSFPWRLLWFKLPETSDDFYGMLGFMYTKGRPISQFLLNEAFTLAYMNIMDQRQNESEGGS